MSKKAKQSKADKAFTGSDKHTLADLKLQPWTPQRVWTAQLLGMAYPNIGKQGRDQLRRSNVYPNAVKDVAIFLFLSTRTNEVEVDEAEQFPEEASTKARDFGISRGIHKRDSTEFWEAYSKFWDVMNEIEDSATKPKSEGPDEHEEESDGPKV